jgi:hypothetical protein
MDVERLREIQKMVNASGGSMSITIEERTEPGFSASPGVDILPFTDLAMVMVIHNKKTGMSCQFGPMWLTEPALESWRASAEKFLKQD